MPVDFSQFRQVGEFSNLPNKRLIRSPKNPMDKCTIISVFPKMIVEEKWTIDPHKFIIPAGHPDKPSTFVVGGSSWWKEFDYEQPMLEIPISSVSMADSIIRDYANGMLGVDMDQCVPGLFFVLGEVQALEVKVKYSEKLAEMIVKQNNWFKVLVSQADSLWSRSGGNPRGIDDLMRLAAHMLGLESKPWLKDIQSVQMVKCKACGTLKNPEYPICPVCKSIDQEHPDAKNLKFSTP